MIKRKFKDLNNANLFKDNQTLAKYISSVLFLNDNLFLLKKLMKVIN